MCKSVTLNKNDNCTVAEVGKGFSWLNEQSIKNNIIINHPNSYLVINMRTNSPLTLDNGKEYAKLYNELASKYPNIKVVAVFVTQVDINKAKQNGLYKNVSLNENFVSAFNNGLKNNLNSNVVYCDDYSKMEEYNYLATAGVLYNNDAYKFIYNEIQKCLK